MTIDEAITLLAGDDSRIRAALTRLRLERDVAGLAMLAEILIRERARLLDLVRDRAKLAELGRRAEIEGLYGSGDWLFGAEEQPA